MKLGPVASLLFVVGVLFGCPGKKYFEDQRRSWELDCIAYGGQWMGSTCSISFSEAFSGDWTGVCSVSLESNALWIREFVKISETDIELTQRTYSDVECQTESPEHPEVKSLSNSYNMAIDASGPPAQRVVFLSTGRPVDMFQGWETVDLSQSKKLIVTPVGKTFSKD